MAMELPPGLRGYVAAEQQGQQQQLGQLQQVQALMGLQGQMQQRAQQQAEQQQLAQLGPNPTAEQLGGIVAKRDPSKAYDIMTRSEDRKAAMVQRAEEFVGRMEAQKRHEDMLHETRLSRISNEQERIAETARKNAADAEWKRKFGIVELQLKQQGIELQRDRIANADKERSARQIEQQVGQTANRMKDVQPVLTAAHQLNGILDKYTPDDVPGVGYAKNTDAGKILLTSEGKDVSSSIKLVGSAILKAMSGTAVTASEEVRQMAAQMNDGRFSAKDFYIAWPKISKWINDQVGVATAGLTPEARPVFAQRSGLNLDPIKPRFAVEYQNGQMNLRDTHRGAAATAGAVPPPPPGFKVN